MPETSRVLFTSDGGLTSALSWRRSIASFSWQALPCTEKGGGASGFASDTRVFFARSLAHNQGRSLLQYPSYLYEWYQERSSRRSIASFFCERYKSVLCPQPRAQLLWARYRRLIECIWLIFKTIPYLLHNNACSNILPTVFPYWYLLTVVVRTGWNYFRHLPNSPDIPIFHPPDFIRKAFDEVAVMHHGEHCSPKLR